MQETVLTLNKSESKLAPFTGNTERESPAAAIALPDLSVRRILLPFDFSKASVALLRGSIALAARIGASVDLLHVVEPGAAVAHDDQMVGISNKMLTRWVRRTGQGGLTVNVSVRVGDAAEEIIARGKARGRKGADLILMSANYHSHSRAVRCVAERVSRDASCPVLTVPEKCNGSFASQFDGFPATKWKRIVVPIDFSEASIRAIRYAAAIAVENRSILRLVRGAPEKALIHTTGEAIESATARSSQRLSEWAENVIPGPINFQTSVWIGNCTFYKILSEATRARADLIVLPTQSCSWAKRLRSESITDGVLRHSACPVLSINKNIKDTEV